MGDPYLPPGCSDSDIDRAYGYYDENEEEEPDDPREDFEDGPCDEDESRS